MILMLEADAITKKNLGDLLNKERIISVNNGAQIFEMICKYQKDVYVVIANCILLDELLAHNTFIKLCQKLAINPPPILSYYKKTDEKRMQDLIIKNKNVSFVEYDAKDPNFPEKFINVMKQLHPEINADVKQAQAFVSRSESQDELINIRKWLENETRLETANQQNGKYQDSELLQSGKDCRQLYYDLQKKHKRLLKIISIIKQAIFESEKI